MNYLKEIKANEKIIESEKDKISILTRTHREKIRTCGIKINRIHSQFLEDNNFNEHYISDFWDCKKSPVGMCVFKCEESGDDFCEYCGEPEERK
jgi:hypothetical protein